MARDVRIWIDVTVTDDADLDTVADGVFQLVAEDPEDVCPEIETVCNSGYDA